MTITDKATRKSYVVPDGDVLRPMGRPQRPDWRMRCELCVILLRSESRVFITGGEFGFDNMVREADDVEIEALAERFNLDELRQILVAREISRADNRGVISRCS